MEGKQPDYSFMKSGFDNLDNSKEEMTKNVTALMVHFMENAIKQLACMLITQKEEKLLVKILKEV